MSFRDKEIGPSPLLDRTSRTETMNCVRGDRNEGENEFLMSVFVVRARKSQDSSYADAHQGKKARRANYAEMELAQ